MFRLQRIPYSGIGRNDGMKIKRAATNTWYSQPLDNGRSQTNGNVGDWVTIISAVL